MSDIGNGTKRLDDFKSDMNNCQDLQTKKWDDHKNEHIRNDDIARGNRRFMIGVLGVSFVGLGAQFLLHFIG